MHLSTLHISPCRVRVCSPLVSSCNGDEGVKHRRGFPAVRKGRRCFQQPTSSPSLRWGGAAPSRAPGSDADTPTDGEKHYLMATFHSDVAMASRSARVQQGDTSSVEPLCTHGCLPRAAWFQLLEVEPLKKSLQQGKCCFLRRMFTQ